jgi:hypothetical protein
MMRIPQQRRRDLGNPIIRVRDAEVVAIGDGALDVLHERRVAVERFAECVCCHGVAPSAEGGGRDCGDAAAERVAGYCELIVWVLGKGRFDFSRYRVG